MHRCIGIYVCMYVYIYIYIYVCVCRHIYIIAHDLAAHIYTSPPIGASFIHIGFGSPIAVPLTLPFSSVAMRLGPVPAGPVHSCVGAAGRFAAMCCVRGGCSKG